MRAFEEGLKFEARNFPSRKVAANDEKNPTWTAKTPTVCEDTGDGAGDLRYY